MKEDIIIVEHKVSRWKDLKVDYLQCHGRGSEAQEELRPYIRRLRTNNVILDRFTAPSLACNTGLKPLIALLALLG
jgi:hypothetical protein